MILFHYVCYVTIFLLKYISLKERLKSRMSLHYSSLRAMIQPSHKFSSNSTTINHNDYDVGLFGIVQSLTITLR